MLKNFVESGQTRSGMTFNDYYASQSGKPSNLSPFQTQKQIQVFQPARSSQFESGKLAKKQIKIEHINAVISSPQKKKVKPESFDSPPKPTSLTATKQVPLQLFNFPSAVPPLRKPSAQDHLNQSNSHSQATQNFSFNAYLQKVDWSFTKKKQAGS